MMNKEREKSMEQLSRVLTKTTSVKRNLIWGCALLVCVQLSALSPLTLSDALAREVQYVGSEVPVFVTPGEVTQITFPDEIQGGFKSDQANFAVKRENKHLIVFPQPSLPPEGESMIVHLNDRRTYSIRLKPADALNPRDGSVEITDERPPEVETASPSETEFPTRGRFAPPSTIAGLAREMVLVSEFGKKKGISGYRRSNRYSGETVLNDGAVKATISEIFMGTDLWGYVLKVENMLNTTQRINPASFRLDGTRAITAQRWQLEARPQTAEQAISNQHIGNLYIITRSKR